MTRRSLTSPPPPGTALWLFTRPSTPDVRFPAVPGVLNQMRRRRGAASKRSYVSWYLRLPESQKTRESNPRGLARWIAIRCGQTCPDEYGKAGRTGHNTRRRPQHAYLGCSRCESGPPHSSARWRFTGHDDLNLSPPRPQRAAKGWPSTRVGEARSVAFCDFSPPETPLANLHRPRGSSLNRDARPAGLVGTACRPAGGRFLR